MNEDQAAVLEAIQTACNERAVPGATARALVPILEALAVLAGVEAEAAEAIERYRRTA